MFNAKRDLHWLRRYNINFQHKKVWDVQLFHFILGGQEEPYPSLDGVAEYYKLEKKLDFLQSYIDQRIDVDEVPLDGLREYLCQDLRVTQDCYLRQLSDSSCSHRMLVLFKLACIDLLILEEIEWNGLVYDIPKSVDKAREIREELSGFDQTLAKLIDLPFNVNWNSGDHLSCVLYGGEITVETRVADGVYKTGKKAGQTKNRIEKTTHTFKRLVNPLENSELDKPGFYSTAEPTLKQLNAHGKAARIIDILLKRAKLEKLVSSYFEGIPKQLTTMRWGNVIHGTLNQCVAATGRLSSSKPNLQNNPKEVDKLFVSRYDVSTT